jgi:hypothetical protein
MTSMQKLVKIIVWGGYHNAPRIKMRIDPNAIIGSKIDWTYLTIAQQKKLHTHMCGTRNCACGTNWSWERDL